VSSIRPDFLEFRRDDVLVERLHDVSRWRRHAAHANMIQPFSVVQNTPWDIAAGHSAQMPRNS
jgi:hypothetical protein